MDYCKYVDIFHGCGEITPDPKGIAAKWFFIKAGCGNTSPAAMRPFGAMSVAPYSGGYPTGYGDHCINTHSRPMHFDGGKDLIGFSHLQQSGTGAIGYYYNYAVVTPKYDNSPFRRTPTDENAVPGYYSCTIEDIKCELTADNKTALHRYTFGQQNGLLQIDLSNNGLDIAGEHRGEVKSLELKPLTEDTAVAKAVIEGINIYFAVRASKALQVTENGFLVELHEDLTVELAVSISLKSTDFALNNIENAEVFDETAKNSYSIWNKALSAIKIDADEVTKRKFYSNLYHSLVKPADWSGESFIYDGNGPFMNDFATLWDMYKTAFPLIFMMNKDIAEKTVETLLKVGETLGEIPNSIGLCDSFMMHSVQARMLGAYVLLTAYRYGINIDANRMVKVIKNDAFADNKKDFTIDHKCQSNTWMLDMADACALTADVAEEIGEYKTAEDLKPLGELWKIPYDTKTGLLSENSDYYEGTLYNYSFRQMVKMDERIKLAGGNENFVKLLDNFFGYDADDVVLPTDPLNYAPIEDGMKLGRFEGFNNESDTEAPFSYIYAGRHDRTCEIVRAGMEHMFTVGKGALPGNNDSCALSSYYVFAALGIFPVAGQDLFLIGSPIVDKATFDLSSGKKLFITVNNNSKINIYVKSVYFNGKQVSNFMLTAKEILSGGTLEFNMTDKSEEKTWHS